MFLKRIILNFIFYFILSNLAHGMGGGNHSIPSKKEQTSSFKACQAKNILLTADGHQIGLCHQGSANSFEELDKILKVGTTLSFQNKLKDTVHTKLEFKIYETQMLEACARNDTNWFKSKNISESTQKAACDKQISQIRSSIRERFPIMRKHLALSASLMTDDNISNNQYSWFRKKISHGLISDFSSLNPLNTDEENEVKKTFIEEISNKMLSQQKNQKINISLTYPGSNLNSLDDLLNNSKKTNPNKSDKEILTSFLSDTKNTYTFQHVNGLKYKFQQEHKNEYYKTMNQMPLMGYINEVNLEDPNSPSNQQIADALSKTNNKLSNYLTKLKSTSMNNTKWTEYAQFIPDIESLLEKNPEFCGAAETLLKVTNHEEKKDMYEDLAIAAVAAVPCFVAGPISETVCIGAGAAIGAKGIIKTYGEIGNLDARNLTDFLGNDGFSKFQALDQKNREIKMQAFLFPLGVWGGGATTGKATESLLAYRNSGKFITKNEGLTLANQAMEKLISDKNFANMTASELAISYDRILAQKALPEHALSSFENTKGGFKLIDTNYDMDAIPSELIDAVANKLGTPEVMETLTKKLKSSELAEKANRESAIKLIKDLYSRHALDHHGSMGNVENATQQVLTAFQKKAEDAVKSCTNEVCKQLALKVAERDLQKSFYKVSTDNLGDGQLATYLVQHNAKQMLTDPKFVKFMDRVANIEDFEAFGPNIYNKFNEIKNRLKAGVKLSSAETEEFDAMNVAMARQKAINDTLLKYGTDNKMGPEKIGLLYADRFHTLPPEVQKKLIKEMDDLTTSILKNSDIREKMANDYVASVLQLAGTKEKPGLVRQAEVVARDNYAGLDSKSVAKAKDEIFAFNASKLRTEYQAVNKGKILGPFEVFHAPQSVLDKDKKILVSISDTGEKRTFVIAFGNGLRTDKDSLKSIAKEIHLVEARTLEKMINETTDPTKLETLNKELVAIKEAISKPTIDIFGGPASLMRSAADNASIKDLVFNFNGIRSSESDILEAVIRARTAK